MTPTDIRRVASKVSLYGTCHTKSELAEQKTSWRGNSALSLFEEVFFRKNMND